MDDRDDLSNTSGDPSRTAHGEAKVRQYLEMGSKSYASGFRHHKSGGDNGPVVKTNYNHSIDLERLDKFRVLIKDLTKIKKLSRVIGFIFTAIPEFLPC